MWNVRLRLNLSIQSDYGSQRTQNECICSLKMSEGESVREGCTAES
jgi:hypothetical protein